MAAQTALLGTASRVWLNSARISDRIREIGGSDSFVMHDTTVLEDGAVARSPGLQDVERTIKGFWQGNGAGIALKDLIEAAKLGAIFSEAPAGAISVGQPYMFMSGYVDSSHVPVSSTDVIGIEGSIKGSGGGYMGRVLRPDVAFTSTGASASLNDGALSTAGWAFGGHVTALTGTGGIVLRIRLMHSTDNTTFTIASFVDVTGPGAFLLIGSGTLNRYVRDTVSVQAGTLTSAQYVSGYYRF